MSRFTSNLYLLRWYSSNSFITYDKLFRFDLTVIKSSPNRGVKLSKTFKESNILNSKEIYEMEIEYIGSDINQDGSKMVDTLYKDLIDGETEGLQRSYGCNLIQQAGILLKL